MKIPLRKDEEIVKVLGYFEGKMLYLGRKIYNPCRYCLRHDEKVEWIEREGFIGYYHPHCVSKIINEFIITLAERMK